MSRCRSPLRRRVPSGPARLLVAILLLLRAGTAFGAPSLDDRIRSVDRSTAQRMLPLATTALGAGLADQGIRILERIVALDGENAAARRELGYVKGAGGVWTRTKEPAGGSPPADDAKAAARAAKVEAGVLEAETWRAREVLKLVRGAAPTPEARAHLLGLLERLPRMAEVHEALGHARVGDRYVRPELVALATEGPGRVAAWRAMSAPRLEVHAVREGDVETTLEVAGHGSWPWFRVGERRVAGTFERATVVWRARRTECAHDLLRHLFGAEAPRWDPPTVCILLPPAYEVYVRARNPDREVAERRLRSGTYRGKDGFAMRVRSIAAAIDLYTHAVGFYTGERLACPRTKGPDGKDVVQDEAYAWFQEGLGYLLTLELWDSAGSRFSSFVESNVKQGSPLPRPDPATRDTLMSWVAATVLAGRGPALRDVLTRSLNGLDFLASMEAWTFLRFLALLDPEAFRRLPAALAAQLDGAWADRADRAFVATYGRGLDALEALWRAWLLEVA